MEETQNYVVNGLLNITISFNSINSLKDYIDDQYKNYLIYNKNSFSDNCSVISNILSKLNVVKSSIDTVTKYDGTNVSIAHKIFHNVHSNLDSLSQHWIPYSHPAIGCLKEVFDEVGNTGVDAFWAMLRGSFKQPANFQQMMGILKAYDLLQERRSLGEASLEDKRFVEDSYADAIEKSGQMNDIVQALDERISSWESSCHESWQSFYDDTDYQWDVVKEKFGYEHNELLKGANQKLSDLEATYQEHLKLEKPAQYWEKSAKKYADAGAWWGGVLALLILVGLVGFVHFYSLYLEGQTSHVDLNTVKGIVLFASGITVYGFIIRVVSRLLMSAAHLQRDSEERAQLTYFYLALIKDGAIDEKSRDIIIQSLFSRTETGLLSGDSSPTMPTTDLIKNFKVGG